MQEDWLGLADDCAEEEFSDARPDRIVKSLEFLFISFAGDELEITLV